VSLHPEELLFVMLSLTLTPLWAQGRGKSEAASESASHLGYPQDWSSHHLILTGEPGKDPLSAGFREPRHVYNRVMRDVAKERDREDRDNRRRRPKRAIHVDGAVSLENGFVPATEFPAKYRF